mgnify:CR=1 FL=1
MGIVTAATGLLAATAVGQNNLVPEFTVDGMVKVLRETSTRGEVITVEQTTVSSVSGGIRETTLVQDFQDQPGSIEFYVRVANDRIQDWGDRADVSDSGFSSVIEKTPVDPLDDFLLRPTLDAETVDAGEYTIRTFIGGSLLSERDVNVTRRTTVVSGFESVTVPAGTFPNAVRVETQEVTEVQGGPDPVVNSTVWLANGVGLVKQTAVATDLEGTETTTTELLSYTAPGNLPQGRPVTENGGTVLPLLSDGQPPAGPSFARPDGWMWTEDNWQWSDERGYWYWIPSGPPFLRNTSTGQIVPRPINGWSYYDWPYFYNAARGTWFFIFQDNLPFVYDPSTGEWRRWGE